MEVSDVLRDRMHEPGGLQRMAAVSVLVHGAAVAAVILAPGGWLSREVPPPKTVMTISLGGGNGGPANGGMTSIGGRAIQAQTPPDVKRPEPVRAPAAATPAMTVPIPNKAPSKSAPSPVVKQAPDQAKGRTPTRGAETREGSALAETGARGQGFGLSSSGGAGSGSTLDVADFCCPDYLMIMVERIRSNWNSKAEVNGLVTVKFTIQRDGTLTDIATAKGSGYTVLDINAQRAVVATAHLPPLPAAFPNPTLGVNLTFEYTR